MPCWPAACDGVGFVCRFSLALALGVGQRRSSSVRFPPLDRVPEQARGVGQLGRVPAGEIEAAVIDQLRAVFRQPEFVAGTWKAARVHADDITEADARAALQQLDPLWDELFPAEQARIVSLLVERVDIGTEGLNVRLRIDGLGGLAREMLAGDMGAAA